MFFTKVDVVQTSLPDPVQFLVPGVLALAVMSTAMVSLGIATGYERRYGVLKRLGSTPLSRAGLLTAKTVSVVALEVIQSLILLGVGAALGWHAAGGVAAAVGLLLIGTVAFAGHRPLLRRDAARRGEPRGRQRAVPRTCCSSAGWPTRSTSCPSGLQPSPRAARRRSIRHGPPGAVGEHGVDRRPRHAHRLGDRRAARRRAAASAGRNSSGPEDALQRRVELTGRRDLEEASGERPVAPDEERLGDGPHPVRRGDRAAVVAGEQSSWACSWATKFRASLGMSSKLTPTISSPRDRYFASVAGEQRELLAARMAPRRPEVDRAPGGREQVRERHVATAERLSGELRRGRPPVAPHPARSTAPPSAVGRARRAPPAAGPTSSPSPPKRSRRRRRGRSPRRGRRGDRGGVPLSGRGRGRRGQWRANSKARYMFDRLKNAIARATIEVSRRSRTACTTNSTPIAAAATDVDDAHRRRRAAATRLTATTTTA